MTPWTIRFSKPADKELARLDPHARKRILRTLHAISALHDPRGRGKALTGNLAGFWRYRIGDYRLICQLVDAELLILVVSTDHRSSIYDQ